MKALLWAAVLLLAVVGGFAIYTFGWRNDGKEGNADRPRAEAFARAITYYCRNNESETGRACRQPPLAVEHIGGPTWRIRLVHHRCVLLDLERFYIDANGDPRGLMGEVCP